MSIDFCLSQSCLKSFPADGLTTSAGGLFRASTTLSVKYSFLRWVWNFPPVSWRSCPVFFILASYWKSRPPDPYSPSWCILMFWSCPSFPFFPPDCKFLKSLLICFIPQTFHHFVVHLWIHSILSISSCMWGLQNWTNRVWLTKGKPVFTLQGVFPLT